MDTTVSFSEGAIIGTRKLLEISIDNIVDADIVKGNEDGTFKLHKTLDRSRSNIISFLHLETIRPLDRERRSRYDLDIRTKSLSGFDQTISLSATILDINDNPPIFEKKEYSVSVNKTVSPGTSLVSVLAVDADSGKNSRLTYHMSDKFASHFSLDRETGLLQTRSVLTCDDQESSSCPGCIQSQVCSILVYAKDQGQPQQSAYTVVKVFIMDSNDHDPTVSFR